MAVLYVTEFASMANDEAGRVAQIPLYPPTAKYTMAIGASSVLSDIFQPNTRFVHVAADAVCHYDVGANPSASTGDVRLPSDQDRWFGVPVESGYRLAVIQGT